MLENEQKIYTLLEEKPHWKAQKGHTSERGRLSRQNDSQEEEKKQRNIMPKFVFYHMVGIDFHLSFRYKN